MVRITGVEISSMPKFVKQNSNIETSENTVNLIYIVRNIRNDDLNIVCHS